MLLSLPQLVLNHRTSDGLLWYDKLCFIKRDNCACWRAKVDVTGKNSAHLRAGAACCAVVASALMTRPEKWELIIHDASFTTVLNRHWATFGQVPLADFSNPPKWPCHRRFRVFFFPDGSRSFSFRNLYTFPKAVLYGAEMISGVIRASSSDGVPSSCTHNFGYAVSTFFRA